MKKYYLFIILLIFTNQSTLASYVNGRFLVIDKIHKFDKILHTGEKCIGEIHYPKLSNEEDEITLEMNKQILDFVHLYVICNKGKRKRFSVNYELPNSDSNNQFSLIWRTKNGKKTWRIDSLNFKNSNGALVQTREIFHDLGNNMLPSLIKLSKGRLTKNINWDEFIKKINNRDIQLYLKEKKWRIVFNATNENERIIDVEIPNYFIQGQMNVTD